MVTKWPEQYVIIKAKISQRLEAEGKRYSAVNAAQLLGASRGRVRAWETGQRPNADDLEAMAREFMLSPRWLLLGEGDPEESDRATGSTPPCSSDPIAQRVDQVACAMREAGVDELKILAAARDMLEGEVAKLARSRGAYGAAEPTAGMPKAAEEHAAYPDPKKAAGDDTV